MKQTKKSSTARNKPRGKYRSKSATLPPDFRAPTERDLLRWLVAQNQKPPDLKQTAADLSTAATGLELLAEWLWAASSSLDTAKRTRLCNELLRCLRVATSLRRATEDANRGDSPSLDRAFRVTERRRPGRPEKDPLRKLSEEIKFSIEIADKVQQEGLSLSEAVGQVADENEVSDSKVRRRIQSRL